MSEGSVPISDLLKGWIVKMLRDHRKLVRRLGRRHGRV